MATSNQISRINGVLFHIHKDISAELSAARLCRIAAFSEQHFHRVFKEVTGESLHQYIRRTRLEQAANQLTFDPLSSVIEVAQKCGFLSLSSFSKAFKSQFSMSPGKWRERKRKPTTPAWHENPDFRAADKRISKLSLPEPSLQNMEPRQVAYVRHIGYGKNISNAWQLLAAWCEREGRPMNTQIGLHHSNPEWIPLNSCRYVACVGIDRQVIRNGHVHSLTIPGGLHACFHIKGRYGDLLPWVSKILNQWLPTSGLKMQTTPGFAVYNRNHFLHSDERFDLSYCLPITFY